MRIHCPEHPEQTEFEKVTTIRNIVGRRGRSTVAIQKKYGNHATKQVIYVCLVCDDIVEQTAVELRRKKGVKI